MIDCKLLLCCHGVLFTFKNTHYLFVESCFFYPTRNKTFCLNGTYRVLNTYTVGKFFHYYLIAEKSCGSKAAHISCRTVRGIGISYHQLRKKSLLLQIVHRCINFYIVRVGKNIFTCFQVLYCKFTRKSVEIHFVSVLFAFVNGFHRRYLGLFICICRRRGGVLIYGKSAYADRKAHRKNQHSQDS